MPGTFITTGNLVRNFPSMREFLEMNAPLLPQPITIQTLAADVIACARWRGWAAAALLDNSRYLDSIQTSDTIVGHCGVGFLKDCLAHGRVGNFLPRSANRGEHIDNHQHELADFIRRRDLGVVIKPATSVNGLSSARREPCAIDLSFERALPTEGSFIVVTSVGGHRQESAITAGKLEKIGCRLLCVVVDERIWHPDEAHQVVTSCARKSGLIPAAIRITALIRRYRPDFVVTHGAGVGLAGVLAARVLGVPVFACETLTRIVAPSRWFKVAVLTGAHCSAPEHATFLRRFPYAHVRPAKIVIVPLSGTAT